EAEAMLPELLKVLLETCASVDVASLLLLEGEVLRVHAAVGLGLEKTVGEIVPVGHSLAGRVAQTRGPIASREAASDPMVTRDRRLCVLSHELKNPLGVILASSYVLEKAALEDAQKRSLARVTSAAGRIDRMINDLLDYTRTRMDRALPIARREVDLLEVCKQVMDEVRLLNPRRVIRLDCEGPMSGSFDPDRVTQVVGNLVNNALRHGDPDAPIAVS